MQQIKNSRTVVVQLLFYQGSTSTVPINVGFESDVMKLENVNILNTSSSTNNVATVTISTQLIPFNIICGFSYATFTNAAGTVIPSYQNIPYNMIFPLSKTVQGMYDFTLIPSNYNDVLFPASIASLVLEVNLTLTFIEYKK